MAQPGSLPIETAGTHETRRAGPLSSALIRHPLRTIVVLLVLVALTIGGVVGNRHLSAWRHRRAALAAAERGDFERAWQEMTVPLDVWPSDSQTHLLAARYARRANRISDATQQLRVCQDLEGVTRDNSLEGSLLRAQQGGLNEVESALHARVMKKDPDSVMILEALAKGYILVYRLNDAMIALGQLLELDPNHGQALFMRSRILNAAERSMLAIEDLRRAVELYPARDDWRQELAELYLEHHFPNEALPLLQDLYTRSDKPDVLLDLARAWRQTGEPEEARRVLDELLASHPFHADGLAEIGQLEKEAGHTETAEALLGAAFRLDPTSYHIGWSLYECLGALGKEEEAAQLREHLLKRKAALTRIHRIAMELAKVGRSPALRYEAGTLCLQLSLDDEGVRWLLSALHDDPNHGPTHQALAEYYERHEQTELAAQHRRQAR
jgi:predicted Zn-dependent protease